MDTPPTPPTSPTDSGQPKKYIRTFAGDIEALGKGKVPDLSPFQEPPRPVEAPSTGERATPLQTYEGDFLDRVKETKASTVSVLAAEQDLAPHPSPMPVLPKELSRSNLLYGIASGLLLIAGSVGAYIAYTKYLSSSAPVALAPTVTAPIFVDDREQVSGTGAALVQAIAQSAARLIPQGSIRLLYLGNAMDSTGSPQATTSIFSALTLSVPSVLLRNVNAEKSMAGIVNASGTQSPFFILSVTAYSDTFAGMLSWERLMPRDLEKLFPPYPASVPTAPIATSTAATSTPITPTIVAAFHDETASNHDVRVYRDAAGKSVLLYGYWNQTTLVIARDAAALAEIFGRLATSRAQP